MSKACREKSRFVFISMALNSFLSRSTNAKLYQRKNFFAHSVFYSVEYLHLICKLNICNSIHLHFSHFHFKCGQLLFGSKNDKEAKNAERNKVCNFFFLIAGHIRGDENAWMNCGVSPRRQWRMANATENKWLAVQICFPFFLTDLKFEARRLCKCTQKTISLQQ